MRLGELVEHCGNILRKGLRLGVSLLAVVVTLEEDASSTRGGCGTIPGCWLTYCCVSLMYLQLPYQVIERLILFCLGVPFINKIPPYCLYYSCVLGLHAMCLMKVF